VPETAADEAAPFQCHSSRRRAASPSLHDVLWMLLFRISEATAVAVIAAAAIGVAFVALAIVGWIFWRAAKRDREAGN